MNMLRTIKNLWWVALLMLSLPDARAYSLAGPIGNGGDAWQTPVIGYGLGGDLNAPKNIGEEFRRNTKVLYYTYDANFLGFFGSNGVVAVDSAFSILNALTNVDKYSTSLSEFPLETRHQNYQAQALGLLDLKSSALELMVEQLGLTDPIRYDWTLHDRDHIAGAPACPVGMEYLVVQRNFDITSSPLNQLQYSPYVNNVLYSYQILEACTGGNPLALAVPFSADPLADTYSPVASLGAGIAWGEYYTGLTRDDVAGLRYLLTTNNVNWETPAPGALLVTSNLDNYTTLTTSNLNTLLVFAQTNDPSLTAATFGVTVTATNFYFTYVTNWNVTATLYAPYGSPAGTQIPLLVSNIASVTFQQNFIDTFGNVITNGNLTNFPGVIIPAGCTNIVLNYSTNTHALLQTVQLSQSTQNGAPYGQLATNVVTQAITLNQPSGEYFTLPPTQCGWQFVCQAPGYTITAVTNVIASATNTAGFVGSESIVTLFTNHIFLVRPIVCADVTPTPALYQGIGNIKFVRADYDSLTGQYWQPVTNNYTMVTVTNGRPITLQFQRIVTQPDFLFSASDQATGPGDNLVGASLGTRNLNFDEANVLPGLAGPGTITSATTITFDKVGPIYFNSSEDVMNGTPYFTETPGSDLADFYYLVYFVWASYDGTTNAPVVYPDGTSIDNLERQMLVQLSPASPLPNGFVDVDYTPNAIQFAISGGSFTQPYTWTASGLPNGLSLSSNGVLSGTPTQSGTFDFTLTMTDYVGRSVQWGYTITIEP